MSGSIDSGFIDELDAFLAKHNATLKRDEITYEDSHGHALTRLCDGIPRNGVRSFSTEIHFTIIVHNF